MNVRQKRPLKMVLAGVACSHSPGSFWVQVEREGREEGGEDVRISSESDPALTFLVFILLSLPDIRSSVT